MLSENMPSSSTSSPRAKLFNVDTAIFAFIISVFQGQEHPQGEVKPPQRSSRTESSPSALESSPSSARTLVGPKPLSPERTETTQEPVQQPVPLVQQPVQTSSEPVQQPVQEPAGVPVWSHGTGLILIPRTNPTDFDFHIIFERIGITCTTSPQCLRQVPDMLYILLRPRYRSRRPARLRPRYRSKRPAHNCRTKNKPQPHSRNLVFAIS